MEKIIKLTVTNQPNAYKVVEKLKALDDKMDLSLAETYVLEKDQNDKLSLKDERGLELNYTIWGSFTGGLIGLLAGPAGWLFGTAFGALFGSLGDLADYDNQQEILIKIGEQIPPGKSMVIAHVYEDWTTPLDTSIGDLAVIERINVDEEMEKASQAEIDKFNKDIEATKLAIKESIAKDKEKLNAKLEELKTKKAAKEVQRQSKILAQKKAYKKWFDRTKDQLKNIIT